MGITIKLGICCINEKMKNPAMECFIRKLKSYQDLEIILFGNEIILEKPIEEWPICDSFLGFFSNGFPLEKVIQYTELRSPYLINDLRIQQQILKDRRKVYQLLEASNVPLPKHIIVNSTASRRDLIEKEDYIELNGKRIYKPFIEKPLDSENHNIYIYYPKQQGGGCRKLYRKIGNASSDYYPDINTIRRDRQDEDDGYIYEEFVKIDESKDVKVYSTPLFSYAELRKAPSVDGHVERVCGGKEKRISTTLSSSENDISLIISKTFKQFVCGYDILRVNGKSFVCDVNGWTMVKGDNRENFYESASKLLYSMLKSKFKDQSSSINIIKSNNKTVFNEFEEAKVPSMSPDLSIIDCNNLISPQFTTFLQNNNNDNNNIITQPLLPLPSIKSKKQQQQQIQQQQDSTISHYDDSKTILRESQYQIV